MSAFDHPTILAESAAVSGPAFRDPWPDTAIAQGWPMPLRVVSAIGVDHARPLNRVAAQAANRWNRVDQRQQLRNIVDVGSSQDRGERCAVGVGDDVVLGAGSLTIGGVRASFWPAPTARTDDESMAAREKSIWSGARSLASDSSWRQSTRRLRASREVGANRLPPNRSRAGLTDGSIACRS